MQFCILMDIDKISPRDCQMPFVIGRRFAEVQILKKVRLVLSLEPFWNFLIKFCIHITMAEGLPNAIYHQSMLCRGPNLEQVNMVLSLEPFGIF